MEEKGELVFVPSASKPGLALGKVGEFLCEADVVIQTDEKRIFCTNTTQYLLLSGAAFVYFCSFLLEEEKVLPI